MSGCKQEFPLFQIHRNLRIWVSPGICALTLSQSPNRALVQPSPSNPNAEDLDLLLCAFFPILTLALFRAFPRACATHKIISITTSVSRPLLLLALLWIRDCSHSADTYLRHSRSLTLLLLALFSVSAQSLHYPAHSHSSDASAQCAYPHAVPMPHHHRRMQAPSPSRRSINNSTTPSNGTLLLGNEAASAEKESLLNKEALLRKEVI